MAEQKQVPRKGGPVDKEQFTAIHAWVVGNLSKLSFPHGRGRTLALIRFINLLNWDGLFEFDLKAIKKRQHELDIEWSNSSTVRTGMSNVNSILETACLGIGYHGASGLPLTARVKCKNKTKFRLEWDNVGTGKKRQPDMMEPRVGTIEPPSQAPEIKVRNPSADIAKTDDGPETGDYVYFRNIQQAYLDFQSKIKVECQTCPRVVIRWLGLTMQHGSRDLTSRDFLRLFWDSPAQVHFDIRMLEPTPDLAKFDPLWPVDAGAGLNKLRSFLNEHASAGGRITGSLFTFSEQPHIHGFAVGDHYYVSWANWEEDGKLHILGIAGYDYFYTGDGKCQRAATRIKLFNSWFEHFRKTGIERFPRDTDNMGKKTRRNHR